jgi:membrane protein DedA with SNARE-associated domain
VRIPFVRFIAVDGAAALVGVPLGFGVAYLFTDQLPAILRGVHRVERLLLLGALVLVAGGIAWLAYRKSRAGSL